jgi:hypothetical protein
VTLFLFSTMPYPILTCISNSKETVDVYRILTNTNVHHFYDQTAYSWPFWISNFSQISSIWHVLILSNMPTQYMDLFCSHYGDHEAIAILSNILNQDENNSTVLTISIRSVILNNPGSCKATEKQINTVKIGFLKFKAIS